MKVKSLKLIFFTSILFIISGAFNDGFSGFALGIPFSIIASLIALKIFKNYQLLRFVIVLSGVSVLINLTLEKNPFVFPILWNGTITIMKDGYLKTYPDGSGGYSETDKETIGEIKYKKILKGETYPVHGVVVNHPDFSSKISLITPIGQFSENDYLTDKNISTNKAVKNQVFTYLSSLMYYPRAIFLLKGKVDRILPGTNVIVEDDTGTLKEGVLSRIVTQERPVKNGDKVRLNCTKAIVFQDRKLCELEFQGVDTHSPYPKDNPLFGKISSFFISVDFSGTPDKNLLIYK